MGKPFTLFSSRRSRTINALLGLVSVAGVIGLIALTGKKTSSPPPPDTTQVMSEHFSWDGKLKSVKFYRHLNSRHMSLLNISILDATRDSSKEISGNVFSQKSDSGTNVSVTPKWIGERVLSITHNRAPEQSEIENNFATSFGIVSVVEKVRR